MPCLRAGDFYEVKSNLRSFVSGSSVYSIYISILCIFDMSERGPGLIYVILLVWLNLELQMNSYCLETCFFSI